MNVGFNVEENHFCSDAELLYWHGAELEFPVIVGIDMPTMVAWSFSAKC